MLARSLKLSTQFVLALIFAVSAMAQTPKDAFNHDIDPNAPWAYDAGPDIETAAGQELVDLVAQYPFMPEISEQILGSQKFRYQFGPTFWRLRHTKDASKILFIGQDATHIAEAAKRTATAGFGGRAQDLAAYFGVDEGAAFMNVYQNTIKGQYGAFNSPYIVLDKNGVPTARFGGYIDNKLWLMTQDPLSPMVQWRHRFLDWFLRNNRDLKLIVLFGGAARDAASSFIESLGGKVGTRISEEDMKRTLVPEMREKFAGGNNTYPVPFSKTGGDLLQDMMGRPLDYENVKDQEAAQAMIKARTKEFIEKAVFSEAGPYQNGLYHPGQIGGYDLDKINIDGVKTISLKGLKLSDGSTVGNVLVVQFPHPSALSRMDKATASKTMQEALKAFDQYVKDGWKIEPDAGRTNKFAAGQPYEYARTDIGPEYYDFGTPGTRMLPVSLASRAGADVIVFGTRDRAKFDKAALAVMADAKPVKPVDAGNIFATQPRTLKERGAFDRGPGELFAKLMKSNLDFKKIFALKPGMTFEKNGIDAYNVKNHPDVADFGHYRGTFNKPRIVILADPQGYDDLITARALTGARGQFLQGLVEGMEIGDDYLVLKTVPFGMDGANPEEWNATLQATAAYREQVLGALLEMTPPELILADGEYAAQELARIFPAKSKIPTVAIARGATADAGLKEALAKIKKVKGFESTAWDGTASNIPRSHLPYGSKVWEGTSGDSVINSIDIKNKGMAFAVVAPKWAYEQKPGLDVKSASSVKKIKEALMYGGFPLPGEKIPEFMSRKAKSAINKSAKPGFSAGLCEQFLGKAG
jgi:uracil-DNA glycosylase